MDWPSGYRYIQFDRAIKGCRLRLQLSELWVPSMCQSTCSESINFRTCSLSEQKSHVFGTLDILDNKVEPLGAAAQHPKECKCNKMQPNMNDSLTKETCPNRWLYILNWFDQWNGTGFLSFSLERWRRLDLSYCKESEDSCSLVYHKSWLRDWLAGTQELA